MPRVASTRPSASAAIGACGGPAEKKRALVRLPAPSVMPCSQRVRAACVTGSGITYHEVAVAERSSAGEYAYTASFDGAEFASTLFARPATSEAGAYVVLRPRRVEEGRVTSVAGIDLLGCSRVLLLAATAAGDGPPLAMRCGCRLQLQDIEVSLAGDFLTHQPDAGETEVRMRIPPAYRRVPDTRLCDEDDSMPYGEEDVSVESQEELEHDDEYDSDDASDVEEEETDSDFSVDCGPDDGEEEGEEDGVDGDADEVGMGEEEDAEEEEDGPEEDGLHRPGAGHAVDEEEVAEEEDEL